MVDGAQVADGEDIDETLLNEIFPVNIKNSGIADLSGVAEQIVVLHSERACTLKKATLVYFAASGVGNTTTIKVGKESDDDYYYTGTSEASKSQWYSKDVTLLQTDLAAGDTVLLTWTQNAANTAEIFVCLEYYYTV